MKVAGIVLLLIVFRLLISGLGEKAGVLLNAPSLVTVIGGTIAVVLMSHSFRTLSLFFRFISLQGNSFQETDRLTLSAFFHTARSAALAMGVLGYVINMVTMFLHMDDPSAIGPSIAVSLIIIFYSIIISELIIAPMNRTLMDNSPKKGQTKTSASIFLLPVIIILATTIPILTATLSISEIK